MDQATENRTEDLGLFVGEVLLSLHVRIQLLTDCLFHACFGGYFEIGLSESDVAQSAIP